MDIAISDQVNTRENLTNNKMWFNGMKKFSSIKIEPVHDESSPRNLSIHVEDIMDLTDIFGG